MSKRTKQNFDAAMMDGTTMIRNSSVLFLGAGGSGKSHTLAALLEEEPPSQRNSTPCVKKPIRTIAHYKVGVSGGRLKRITEDTYSDMLGGTVKRFQVDSSSSKKTTPTPAASKPQEMTSQKTTSLRPSSASSSVDSQESTTKKVAFDSSSKKTKKKAVCGFDRELQRRMQALPKASEDLNEKNLMDLKDSGGQPSFHEVLPLFVDDTSFAVITVKLNERMDDYPDIEFFINGKAVGEPFKSYFTHGQTFRNCTRVVLSTCKCDKHPKFIVFGTHKDLEHECKPKESREEKNRRLRELIPPAMRDDVIYCDESLEEVIFGVNVKTPRDDDRQVIDRVRDILIQELLKVPQQRLPLRYFALENAFVRLAKYQGKAVLSKEECFQEAVAFHFTMESFEGALRYLHSLKLIFYYEAVLPGLVFLDAQTLLDKISELVEYSLSLRSKKKTRKVPVTKAGTLEEFKAYGIVTLELLSQFQTHYVPNIFTAKELVVILKYLRVLAEVSEDKFLMPCLLSVVNIDRLSPHLAVHNIPALLFYFGADGAKLGVFCCLISSLITEAKWELMTENDRPVQVARNQVQFMLPGDDPGAITISDSLSSFFHISITFPRSVSSEKAQQICSNICPSVRETILASIRKAHQKLNYHESNPKIAFPCTEHQASTCDLHPAIVSSSGLLKCTTHPKSVCNELTEQHHLWLGKSSQFGAGMYFISLLAC